jgi:hypothetical protein
VHVHAGKRTTARFELPEAAILHLKATDATGTASPARWTFEGLGDTPTPDFGPSYDLGAPDLTSSPPRGTRPPLCRPGATG